MMEVMRVCHIALFRQHRNLLTLTYLLAIWTCSSQGLRELQSPHLLSLPAPTRYPHVPPYVWPSEEKYTTGPPVFQQENNTELLSQVGSAVVLHCHTEHVGENTVSWIRRRDYHLLTVGAVVYSSDQRFSVSYIQNEKDWQLHIKYVQKRDEGVYECQIATHPPISLLSILHVVEATSEIVGAPEKYMTAGSSLRLVCVLKKNMQPPSYVFWYHGDRMINYDNKLVLMMRPRSQNVYIKMTILRTVYALIFLIHLRFKQNNLP